jgi:hypothetical protein
MIPLGYLLIVALIGAIAHGMTRLPLSGGPQTIFGTRLESSICKGLAARKLRQYRWSLWLLYALTGSSIVLLNSRLDQTPARYLVSIVGAVVYTALAMLLYGAFGARLRRFAVVEPSIPLAIAARRRSLLQYSSWRIEFPLLALNAFALALAGGRQELAPTVLLLYGQALLLFLKHAAVHSSLPLPAVGTESYLSLSEKLLRTTTAYLDRFRFLCAALLAAMSLLTPSLGLIVGLAVAVFGLWDLNRTYRKWTALSAQLRSLVDRDYLPRLEGKKDFLAGGLLYFNPTDPSVVVSGPVGYTLNMANPRSAIFVLAVLGLITLTALFIAG